MKDKSKKVFKIVIIVVTLVSLCINVFLYKEVNSREWNIHFKNANSRDTYFTIHNVKEAQGISKGKGIKVGILDHFFGYKNHKDFYTAGADFIHKPDSLNDTEEHGYWMADVLKEIAPDCEVYALNTADGDEDKRVTAMIKAIDYAIKNHIDVLTYSQSPISDKNRKRFDEAINRAVKHNIVTTFIHYDNPNNIWPGQIAPSEKQEEGKRKPDFSVLQYDYNTLLLDTYDKYKKNKKDIKSGDDIPYFSISSTSPVTAGFIAILKGINNKLTPDEYRQILKKTSYETTFKSPFSGKEAKCKEVVDIGKAALYLKNNFSSEKLN